VKASDGLPGVYVIEDGIALTDKQIEGIRCPVATGISPSLARSDRCVEPT